MNENKMRISNFFASPKAKLICEEEFEKCYLLKSKYALWSFKISLTYFKKEIIVKVPKVILSEMHS